MEKRFIKRTIHISCRHRQSFQSDYQNLNPVLGVTKKIVLNSNENYSVYELKDITLLHYVNNKNKYFLITISHVLVQIMDGGFKILQIMMEKSARFGNTAGLC